jgi:hypothetical protein
MDGTAEQFPFRGMGYDVLPHVSLAAGNILTYGNLGLQARLGWNLPTDFGVTVNRIADGVTAPAGTSDPRLDQGGGKGRKWGFHFLAGADGYGVARNIFLDGNTWRSSPHADKEPFVADLYTGIAGTWGRYKISFTESYRTKEFERQDSQGQLIGSITISYTW